MTFSREAFAAGQGGGGAGDLPVPTQPDTSALAEIVAAGSRANEGAPPEDRDALIGVDTGVIADGGAHPPAPRDVSSRARVRVGSVQLEPELASPAAERAARAQLYWPLVQRCRAEDGGILPPEVVRLTFRIDHDGAIVPASIVPTAVEPRYADAARCMARELAAAPFRAPAGAGKVVLSVPSVD